MGALTWDEATAMNLGIPHLTEAQRRLLSGMILTKPVSPCEAALTLLGISPVELSTTVTYVNSMMPGERKVIPPYLFFNLLSFASMLGGLL